MSEPQPDITQGHLVVNFGLIRRRVARILGYPDRHTDWEQWQERNVDDVIADGLRQYYNPPITNEYGQHVWSFMFPTSELTTVAGQDEYELPPDFTSFDREGNITYTSENNAYGPITIVSEAYIRRQEHVTTWTTYPSMAAVLPIQGKGEEAQRFKIRFYPTPDSSYRLRFQYHAMPYMISDKRPYPLGGAGNGEGILSSCLAAAEIFKNDQPGAFYQRFIERLKADIEMDNRRGPASVGYNGNPRSIRHKRKLFGRDSTMTWNNPVTYNGQSYDGT